MFPFNAHNDLDKAKEIALDVFETEMDRMDLKSKDKDLIGLAYIIDYQTYVRFLSDSSSFSYWLGLVSKDLDQRIGIYRTNRVFEPNIYPDHNAVVYVFMKKKPPKKKKRKSG